MNTFSASRPWERAWPILILSFLLVAPPILAGSDMLPEAVRRGDAVRIRSLLAGHPDLQARDADGNTALHWAALHGDSTLVKELLERGAVATATNQVGATPLLYAVGN